MVDAWTSPNNLAFMGVVCYYIDNNWTYALQVIGFKPLSGAHTGENLAAVMMEVLKNSNWDI